jgi:hypothetical protein
MQKIKHGRATVTVVPNQVSTVHVTFDEPFEAIPDIQVSAWTSAVGIYFKGVSFMNPSTTGFDIAVYRTEATNTVVHWQAVNEESYDGEDWLDYAVIKWSMEIGMNLAPVKLSGKNQEDTVYTVPIVFWESEGIHAGYIKPADAANFTALAALSGDTITYNGGNYVTQDTYGPWKMEVLDMDYQNVSSKFDFDGAANIMLYLTPNTGGQSGELIGTEKYIKVRYIEVEYTQAYGGGTAIYHGDGVSSFGYVNTFGDEFRGLYGTFFPPVSG